MPILACNILSRHESPCAKQITLRRLTCCAMLLQTDLPQMEADAVAALLGAKSADPVEPVPTGVLPYSAWVLVLVLILTVLVSICWGC